MWSGLTPDDVDHDPVWRGVGGYAGVIAAQPGGGVSHCQPAQPANELCKVEEDVCVVFDVLLPVAGAFLLGILTIMYRYVAL